MHHFLFNCPHKSFHASILLCFFVAPLTEREREREKERKREIERGEIHSKHKTHKDREKKLNENIKSKSISCINFCLLENL
jgi:hypothetical protein